MLAGHPFHLLIPVSRREMLSRIMRRFRDIPLLTIHPSSQTSFSSRDPSLITVHITDFCQGKRVQKVDPDDMAELDNKW